LKKIILLGVIFFVQNNLIGQTQLLNAIEKNDTLLFNKVLAIEKNVNRRKVKISTKFSISRKKKLRNGKIVLDKNRRKGVPLISFRKSQRPISKAALRNNFYFLQSLLNHGAKPNKKDKLSVLTPLSWAAHNGNLDAVKLLLANGADINGHYKEWKTSPLIEAIEWRHWDVAEYLVANGANINIVDKEGRIALSHAAIQKNYFLSELLVKNGAKINHFDNNGFSVLEHACGYGVLFAENRTNFDLITYLIEAGAKTNNNVIESVVQKGELDILKYLLRKGAPLKKELIIDASSGINIELFKFLFDTLKLDNIPSGVLHRICDGFWTNGADRTLNIELLRYVLDIGVNIYELNHSGQNVFTTLVAYGKPDSITYLASKILLEKTITAEIKKFGVLDYPLKRAANQGLFHTCQLFIDHGADVNHSGDDGGSILHQAAWFYNNHRVLDLLIKRGANPNAVNKNGLTAAMGATFLGRTENIKSLAELGADLNIKSISGLTLLDMISDEELIMFLKSKGAKSGKEK
jgi:ankyrin repeat protein